MSMDKLSQDLRWCLRSVQRQPASWVAVIVVLAVAVGIDCTLLSLVDALLFGAPIGLTQPDRLLRASNSWMLDFGQYARFRENVYTISLTAQSARRQLSVNSGSDAEPVDVRFVSSNYFSVLGANPTLGRSFIPEDERRHETSTVAILGHSFWSRRFGGDPTVVGRTIYISNRICTIIGVAPMGFSGVDPEPVDVWLPASTAPLGIGGVWLLGRLVDGISIDRAKAEIVALWPADAPTMQGVGPQGGGLALRPVYEDFTARLAKLNRFVVFTVGAGTVMLLIACLNVAGLLLHRAIQRSHDIAIRIQLGATRSRLVRQLGTEVILLGSTCGLFAFVVVACATPLLQRFMAAPIPGWWVLSRFPRELFSTQLQRGEPLNARTLLATMFCALLAAILSSLPSILYTLKLESAAPAKSLHWIEPQQVRLRTGFLALQVALTVMLLVSAGLFTKSFLNALNVKLGIDTDHVVVATVDLRSAGYSDADAARALESKAENVRALPGVTHMSLSLSVPIGLSTKFYMRTKIPGREWPYGKGQPAGNAMTFVNAVSPQYFDLLGMRILQGRGFRPSDTVSNPLVVIIDEKLARDLFPGENPLGQCVMFSTGKTEYQCRRIVGVASSIRNEVVRHPEIDDEQDPAYYVSASQWSASRYVLIRTRNNPGPVMRTIGARLQTAAPNLPYVKVEPLSLYRDQQTHGWRMGSALFGSSGILSLALAGIGIYAVIAFVVRQRTREIGIRIAIGATQADIRGLIVRTGLAPVVIGIAFGVAGAFASTRLMAALLFGVVPFDPAILMGSAFLPFIVGATACIIPSRRATRVDPAVSLRDE